MQRSRRFIFVLRCPALPVGTHGPCVLRVHWNFPRNIHLLEDARAFSGDNPIEGGRTSRASLLVNHSSLLFFLSTDFTDDTVLAMQSARYLCNQCNHVDYIVSSVSRESTRIFLINRFHGLYCFLLVILAIRGDQTPRRVSV